MAQRVISAEAEVVPLLTRMRLPRWAILEIVTMIAGERANVSSTDAPPVIGFETWRWGIRFCREHPELQSLGWSICEQDQVSGIRNDALQIKLVFCNTDWNTGNPERAPKNTNEKGVAGRRLIERNTAQLSLLPDPNQQPPVDLWYLCAHFCDAHIAVEISRPTAEVAGFVTAFSDRLILARPGEIPGVRRTVVPEEFAEVPKPQVRRKV